MDLNLGLDNVDGVAALNFESDTFAGKGFHEDLHDLSFFFFFSSFRGWTGRASVKDRRAREEKEESNKQEVT